MGHSWDKRDAKLKRDEARVVAPETSPHRSSKNRRRWCRGKPGVEHQPVMTKRGYHSDTDTTCRRCPWGLRDWWCYHVDQCATCGRVLRHYEGRECPDFEPRED
jgi:hypothetical protein